MVNHYRLTTKLCVLGTVVDDLVRISAWAKENGYSLIAVGSKGRDTGYDLRVVTKTSALLDISVQVNYQVIELSRKTMVEGKKEKAS